jgi:RNA polymerase sigma factor (sigma-70 family)
MPSERAVLHRSIETLMREGAAAGLDDRVLLDRLAGHRDGQALAALIDAHGPMVLGVCRRILHRLHDADDAFQSTFLLLVRKAGAIRDPARLAGWLHGVACRVAVRIRSQRRRWETVGKADLESLSDPSPDPVLQAEHIEMLELLDEEIGRLPARHRDVIVLCDLEGRSYAEAAQRLRCPLGTVQSRLARGRDQLQRRMIRRGGAMAAAPVPFGLSARTSLPVSLREATLRAAQAAWNSGILAGTAVGWLKTGLTIAAMVVGAGTCFTVLGTPSHRLEQPPPAEATGARNAKPDPGHEQALLIEIRGAEDNKVLPGAAVWIQVSGGQSREPNVGRTDGSGHFSVDLGEGPIVSVTVVVAAEGYVPKESRWGADNIPVNPVIGLERGVRIGGRVVDEQGQPIQGARILPCALLTTGEEVGAALSDAQGRWQSSALAASAVNDKKRKHLTFRLSHRDYITVRQDTGLDEACGQNAVLRMKRGASLSGRVTGPDGKPVVRARVVVGQPNAATFETETDAAGRFRFGHCLNLEWSSADLTVKASGLAASARTLLITQTIPELVIALDQCRPLRGRVVDTKGVPVAGVSVWPTELSDAKLDWRAATDAHGRFEWPDAPTSGSIRLDLYKSGFAEALGRTFVAGQREIKITLHRPLHLRGTVSDAVTGKPVERFDLIPGWGPHRPGARVEWLNQDASKNQFTAGKYDLHGGLFPDQGLNRSIRIEAEGYLPAELLGFRDDAEDLVHDFKLRKAVPLSGIVRGAGDQPLAGALVALSNSDNDVRIKSGTMISNRTVGEATQLKTGPDGRYAFRPQGKPAAIVVVHDAGFAVRTAEQLAASTDVTIHPWARIEGVLKVGSHIAPKQKVSAWMVNQTFSGRVDYDTVTDAQGRFIFERVTPGVMMVYRNVDHQDHQGWTPSNPVFVDVSPGLTLHVQVGGAGRPVIGRLQVPQGFSLADLVSDEGQLTTGRVPPHQPDGFPDFTPEQQEAWYDRFYKTAEGRGYFQGERQYAVDLQADGSFRIEDVPAGNYALELHFKGRHSQYVDALFAFAHGTISVPPIPGARSDEPLDMGVVKLNVFRFRELKVGDQAPAITRNLPDGRPLDLGSLRGKVVLLHFWETYQSQGLAELPVLKETHEAFGRDPGFVMIGLNQNEDFDLPKRYAAKKGYTWEQRYVGLERPNPITAAFGVRFPPEVMLIGPDGRILAKDLKGPEIKEAVAQALKQGK